MRDHRNSFWKTGILVLMILAAAAAALYWKGSLGHRPGPGSGKEETGTEGRKQAEPEQSLSEFCEDKALDAWFDSIEESTPVKLTYILYGEGPVSMEFTDPGLILKAAKALMTVRIGGPSEQDPDNISDAGGSGYYFEMEDGTKMSFSFIFGSFRWKKGKWHDVADYGELIDVGRELERIGNPQYTAVYAQDMGFYTEVLETYGTVWQPEDGLGGGLFIYPEETGQLPFVQICRCEGDRDSLLNDELDRYMRAQIRQSGAALLEEGGTETLAVYGKELPCVLYTAELPEEMGGGTVCYRNLLLDEMDDLLGEPCLIRFCAAYREAPSQDADALVRQEKVLTALYQAVREFTFKHKAYTAKDVQPDNYLPDFINDDRIRAWFAGLGDHFPDMMTCTTDSWENFEDPEDIRQTLEALKTVKIGGRSEKRVGASDRRIYDFLYTDSGAHLSFDFFADTFYWNGVSYDVLDWGKLKK